MFAKYMDNSRFVVLFLVHLTALIGILSLWNVAESLYFFIFLSVYILGIYMDFKSFYPIRRVFLTLFGFILSLYFLSFLSLEDLLKPFAHVVLLLLSVKSLEEKKPRDLYQILLLGLFALSISTAYNLSLSFLLVFLLYSFLGLTSLVFLNLYRKVGERRLGWLSYRGFAFASLLFFLLVLFLTPAFFFLLPRSQAPLFDLFSRGSGLRTGLADSVSLGKVGQIQEDNTVAFRVYGLSPNLKDPYWRAIVFDRYEKNVWLREKEIPLPQPREAGEEVYTLVIEPSFDNIIPALDYPYSILKVEGINANAYITQGNTLRLDREINRAIMVRVSSSREMYIKEDPEKYLDVPKDISPNIKRLAMELERGARDGMEKVKSVIRHFSKGYKYTLKLERYEGDPLDYFLFVSKKGNCEYYASATALLLRMMGVPARVVGGYKGALWNKYGGYHIVTNSMAHVWVEAYVNGEWIRVDTTPPYVSPALKEVSTLSLIKDYIVSFWYSNVVGYSSEKQIKLFRNIGKGIGSELSLESLRKRFLQAFYLIVLTAGLYLTFHFILRQRKTPENLYYKTKALLVKEGIVKENTLPEEILYLCKDKEYYRLVKFILSIYQRHRYSPYKVYPDEIREGYRALKELKGIIRNFHRS